MDLPFSLTGPKPKAALEVTHLGEIDRADIARAQATAEGPGTATTVKRIRDSHHKVARLLADGLQNIEVAAITGYTPQRIYLLKQDPTFQELMEYYRGENHRALADFRERLQDLGLDALQELHERLDSAPDDFSNNLLLELTKVIADRTGHAPATKSPTTAVQVNIGLSDRIRKARERVETITQEPSDD